MSRDTESSNQRSEYLEEKKLAWERRKLGIELRHKFEFYFVILIFSILGVLIQTSKRSSCQLFNYFEVSGWILLFISGCIGLYSVNKLWLREVGAAEMSIRSLHSENITELKKDVEKIEGNIKFSLKLKYILFVIGMSFILVSRVSQFITFKS